MFVTRVEKEVRVLLGYKKTNKIPKNIRANMRTTLNTLLIVANQTFTFFFGFYLTLR